MTILKHCVQELSKIIKEFRYCQEGHYYSFFFLVAGTIEVKESVPLVCNKSKITTSCSTCITSNSASKNKVKQIQIEMSCQTEEEPELVLRKRKILDVSTQTASRWVQISLNSPPLSLTQEVPDVVL